MKVNNAANYSKILVEQAVRCLDLSVQLREEQPSHVCIVVLESRIGDEGDRLLLLSEYNRTSTCAEVILECCVDDLENRILSDMKETLGHSIVANEDCVCDLKDLLISNVFNISRKHLSKESLVLLDK